MFKFLKDKLKSAISSFSEKVEKQEPIVEEDMPPKEQAAGIDKKLDRKDGAKDQASRRDKTPARKDHTKEQAKRFEKTSEKEVAEKKEQIGQRVESAARPGERGFFRRLKDRFSSNEPEKEHDTKEIIPEDKPQVAEHAKKEPVPDKEIVHDRPQSVEQAKASEPKIAEVAKPKVTAEAPKKEMPKPAVFKERVPAELKETAKPVESFQEQKKTVLPVEPEKVQIVSEPAARRGIFQRIKDRIQTVTISEEKFNELFWDLEVVMLENNVAVEVIDTIKSDLKKELVEKPIPRGSTADAVVKSLARSVKGLFVTEHIDILDAARKKKPYVICFVGVNGSGKTTTIAKVARLFQSNQFSVVLAAADTFRAAAIDQLQLHADRLNVKLIRHDYGSDAAAVAFDAIKHAESKNKDVVLIDTAGRMHSNANLMDEMKKVVRVAKPDLVVFIGEAITGNDCVEQARMFSEAVQIDAIILSKADVDEKG
ncbi:MAG: AAA family ATPase, partial [Candidatus Woesearchaeota archaeon]